MGFREGTGIFLFRQWARIGSFTPRGRSLDPGDVFVYVGEDDPVPGVNWSGKFFVFEDPFRDVHGGVPNPNHRCHGISDLLASLDTGIPDGECRVLVVFSLKVQTRHEELTGGAFLPGGVAC